MYTRYPHLCRPSRARSVPAADPRFRFAPAWANVRPRPSASLCRKSLHEDRRRLSLCNCLFDRHFVSEPAQRSQESLSPLTLSSRVGLVSLLHKSYSVVQYLPHQLAESVGDGPNGSVVTQSRYKTAEHRLQMAALLLHRRLRCLIQNTTHVLVALGGATGMVVLGTFLLSRTDSHPGGQVGRRSKRAGLRPYLRDHLLG